MKSFRQGSKTTNILGALAALALIVAVPLFAGTTQNTSPILGLFDPQGEDSPRASGDYIVAATGLNTFYRYYIEVPPSLPRFVVQLFDADIGKGGGEEAANRDRGRDAGFSSVNQYRLVNPAGVTVATLNSSAGSTTDNAWLTLYDVVAAVPGIATVGSNSGTLTTGGTGANLAVTVPAGTVGDQLIAMISVSSAASIDIALPTPATWTALGQQNCNNVTGGCRLEAFSKTATVGDTTVTFAVPANSKAVGAVFRYSGVDTGTAPIVTVNFGSSDTPVAPSVTTVVANNRVIRLLAANDNELSGAPHPGGHTGLFTGEIGGGSGDVAGAAADIQQAAIGASGTANFDLDASETWATMSIALRPSLTVVPIPNGHWELLVDPQVGTGDDLNAIGLRAHDGDASSAGTELPIYYDSHTQYGTNDDAGAPSTRSYDVFPWITSGCTFGESDFDFDNGTPTGLGPAGAEHGRIELVRPTSTVLNDTTNVFPTPNVVHHTIASSTLSGNDVWNIESVPRWNSDSDSVHYGIWRADIQISEYTNNSNYSNVYFHNFESAGGTPAANPTTNAFRVYLRNDGDGAPVKPYLEQFIRIIGPVATPPDQNVPALYTVTARIVNPTASAITFSTSPNVVTVPLSGASQVQYIAGSASASQGSVTSEPAANASSGSVVWEPGSIAAQSAAVVSFRVRITPTVALARILVTQGPDITPSLTGTRAQYLDETGNSGQARATYLLGPVCEVAITENGLTRALVTTPRAIPGASGSLVEWTTASEDGTAAFQLYRLGADRKWTAVGDWVMADAKSAQGAVYRVADPGLAAGTAGTYMIVERERGGKTQSYGPYTIQSDANASPRPRDLAIEAGRASKPVSRAELKRLAMATVERSAAEAQSSAREGGLGGGKGQGSGVLKITTSERGMTVLTAAALASAFGESEKTMASLIQKGNLRLETEGMSVATFAEGDTALYFYAEPKADLFSNQRIYWLRQARGNDMGKGSVWPLTKSVTSRFIEKREVETDAFAVLVLPSLAPDSDYWFWDVVTGDAPARTFPVTLPDAAPSTGYDGLLTVRLRGATSVGVADEHEVQVRWNGNLLGTERFTGNAEHVATYALPSAWTAQGTGEISLSSRVPSGAAYSAQFVDGFEILYDRQHRGNSGRIEFNVRAAESVSIPGFAGSDIALFDVSEPRRPRRLHGATAVGSRDGSTGLGFRAQTAGRLHAARLTNALTPTAMEYRTPSSLAGSQGAEYVVIAPSALATQAAALASYRAGQGLSSMAVDLQDIYDEFAFGYARPSAIRDFLLTAYANWTTPPRLVVLAGEGTYDYRDLTGFGANLVPARMIATESGLYAADASYGDVDGDGVSEMAIGRLPVASGSELASFVARLQALESAASDAAFRRRLIVASDNGGAEGADFKPQAEAFIARTASPAEVHAVHLSDLGPAPARSALLSELNAGASALVYYGHAGRDRFADESILASTDLSAVSNAGRSPFVAAMTCSVNRFELPGFPALGEEMVRSSSGAAIAVWSPSGLSGTANAHLLGDILAGRLYASPSARVGDVLLDVTGRYLADGGSPDVLALYHLIGDPATTIYAPTPVPPVAGPPSSGE